MKRSRAFFVTRGLLLFLAAALCYARAMSSAADKPEQGLQRDPEELDRESLLGRVYELESNLELVRKLYTEALVRCRTLEKGLLTTTRERLDDSQKELTLDILGALLADEATASEPSEAAATTEPTAPAPEEPTAPAAGIPVAAHVRKRGGGRRVLPEHLPRMHQVILPDEVIQEGLVNFELIGEERSETLERRTSSLYVVETVRQKFVRKDRDRDRSQQTVQQRELAGESYTEVLIAEPPVHPLPRALAGPGLLAETVVQRWQDKLPLHRLEGIYRREGLQIPRSTVCTWHLGLSELVAPLIAVMWADARGQPILYTDATGVRVQAKKKCRRSHFWVVIAPERHILVAYSRDHKKGAVDALFVGFSGKLVADAHTVYDHLYLGHGIIEVGCWAHVRRYLHKTLSSQPEVALVGLALVNELFGLERRFKGDTAEVRKRHRQALSKPLVDRYFAWCRNELPAALENTPLYAALRYSLNQETALGRFLEDGRLPLHNNASERALRGEAVGRKNWLFLGSDDGGEANARLTTLLASCELHGLDPRAYLRDLFCLLPVWPRSRLLELAPVNWGATRQTAEVELQLLRNTHWRAATGTLCELPV